MPRTYKAFRAVRQRKELSWLGFSAIGSDSCPQLRTVVPIRWRKQHVLQRSLTSEGTAPRGRATSALLCPPGKACAGAPFPADSTSAPALLELPCLRRQAVRGTAVQGMLLCTTVGLFGLGSGLPVTNVPTFLCGPQIPGFPRQAGSSSPRLSWAPDNSGWGASQPLYRGELGGWGVRYTCRTCPAAGAGASSGRCPL